MRLASGWLKIDVGGKMPVPTEHGTVSVRSEGGLRKQSGKGE